MQCVGKCGGLRLPTPHTMLGAVALSDTWSIVPATHHIRRHTPTTAICTGLSPLITTTYTHADQTHAIYLNLFLLLLLTLKF